MPFKNLHRRRSGLTPKTKGILSHSNTNTTTYACTLTHSQPYMHAYTHKPAQLFKKLRTIFFFFFHKAPQNFQWTRNALTTETWSYQEQTSQANRPLVKWWVWLWGFGGGGQSSIPNKFLFCCCCLVLLMDLRLMLGVRQSVTGTYTKLIFKHILTTVWTVQCSHFYGNYTHLTAWRHHEKWAGNSPTKMNSRRQRLQWHKDQRSAFRYGSSNVLC